MILALQAVWVWLKRYWQWLAGVLLLAIGAFFGVSVKKRPVIVQGQNLEKDKAEATEKKEVAAAEQKHDATITVALTDHDKAVDSVTLNIEEAAQRIVQDPDATNEYLLKVGKDVRGGK